MANFKVCLAMYGAQDYFDGEVEGFLEIARMADRAGVHQLTFTDHVIMSENTDKYPFGPFPVPPDYPWFEPLTLLAAIAAVTERIRLTTAVLIAPLRPAPLLAKTVATLDQLSAGRIDLGVGTGWQREEYEACGLPFERRMSRLRDQLQALRGLWSEAPMSMSSETVSLDRMYSKPFPHQPRVPIWFGVKPSEENARMIAEFGDGWVPIQTRVDFISDGVSMIRRAFEAAGRDPAELKVRAVAQPMRDADGNSELARAVDRVQPLVDAGATHIEFMPWMFVQGREDFPSFLDTLGSF